MDKIAFSQSPTGPVSFYSKQMDGSGTIQGFMLYGAMPLGEKENLEELRILCRIVSDTFGQDIVELHYAGMVKLLSRRQGGRAAT